MHFQEGAEVKKGDLLYTLKSQPFQEKVATRMSNVTAAKTNMAKAKGDLDRYELLARANLRGAEIELGYTKIYSPIDGIIGKNNAKVGSYWLITEGLEPGEKVVYEGLQKISDGAAVKPAMAQTSPTHQQEK